MTVEEFIRAALIAKNVNNGEAIYIGSGPFNEWSSTYNAQVLIQEYMADLETSLDGRRFWRRRIQIEVASTSPRNAMLVAEHAASAIDYIGPHNPAQGLADMPFVATVISGPSRTGSENGVYFVAINVEVLYGEES
ncbi:MAG: hypothetical protein QXW98_04850 [Candidatus Caldarchaeum sp.]